MPCQPKTSEYQISSQTDGQEDVLYDYLEPENNIIDIRVGGQYSQTRPLSYFG